MNRNSRSRRVSPRESVEGPEIKARPEAVDGDKASEAETDRRPHSSEPKFPTGANKRRRQFSRRRRNK